MKNRASQGSFAGNMTTALGAMALKQLPEFHEGDLVKSIRFRLRMELAGEDWIATDSKVVERIPPARRIKRVSDGQRPSNWCNQTGFAVHHDHRLLDELLLGMLPFGIMRSCV